MLVLPLLLLQLLLLLPPPARPQHLENDLQSLLSDLDSGGGGGGDDDFEVELLYRPESEEPPQHPAPPPPHPPGPPTEGVRRLWGVSDTRATVGRLFSHPVPKDAFQGDVVSYQVKGLPSWLAWDGRRGVVEGVARRSDLGHHYVTVRAHGSDGSHAKDVFAIEVVDVPGARLSQEGGCRGRGDVTLLSVLLDTHLSSLSAPRRIALLRAASKLLGHKEVSLVPAPHDADPLADDSALLAGPGSARPAPRPPTAPRGLSQLQWVVGCGGEVGASSQPLVDQTEEAAKSGTLQRLLGVPVLGWHTTQVNPSSRRVRRQIEYSGDYDGEEDYAEREYGNYGDYENYDYENYDYEGGNTEHGKVLSFDYDLKPEPETRVIPSLATPTFPEASATLVYPGGGGRVHPDPSLHFSPVPISTPVYVPDKPTRILEASPTVAYESPYSTDIPPYLEGSMIPQPSTAGPVSSTTPLTATTTRPPVSVSTRPIEASSVPSVPHTETEIGVKNYPPHINNRLRKLAWIAGHVYRLSIPRDTFGDLEDGDTRNLQLLFKTSQGFAVGPNSWIQFNPATQEIYALPLEKDIGRYSYLLEAVDSEGKTITDTVIIHVQQPRQARNYNHRFTATLSPEKKFEYKFVYSLDWQIRAVQKIAQVYGDENTDNINVRSISTNPIKVTWTNVTLADSLSTSCPEVELATIKEVVLDEDNSMTRKVKEVFKPEFNLKRIHLHYMGHCEVLRVPKPGHPVTKPEEDRGESDGGKYKNDPPIIRNQIDYLNAMQGSLFRFKVPTDTCYDMEDGDSFNLQMRLLTSNLSPPLSSFWLQFDDTNKEFFGIPLKKDVGKTEYILECMDKGGEKVSDALFVNVLPRAREGTSVAQFSLTLDLNFTQFTHKPQLKARLVESIARVFGDEDTSHVSIDDFQRGSVVVTWHNKSLPSDHCPNREVKRLRQVMLDDDGNLLPAFVDSLRQFNVTDGRVTPSGVCLAGDIPTHPKEEVHQPAVESDLQGEDNDYLLNFIIPAVIIAAMLLLAAIIACCLYRRRRYGKMTMADDATFVSRGIPIIFAEELDDRPDPAKSPVIMKEEKPPLPPPEYQRGNSPAASSTPPASDRRRRPQSGGEAGDDAPSYQPPPPFTATNGASRHPRPNMPPTYRKPPTYVPP